MFESRPELGKTLTAEAAIVLLGILTDEDEESAHIDADNILLAVLRGCGQSTVADAYIRAAKRIRFYYV